MNNSKDKGKGAPVQAPTPEKGRGKPPTPENAIQDLSPITEAIGALSGRIDDLSNNQVEISKSIESRDEAIAAAALAANQVKGSVDTLATATNEVASEVAELKAQSGNFATKVDIEKLAKGFEDRLGKRMDAIENLIKSQGNDTRVTVIQEAEANGHKLSALQTVVVGEFGSVHGRFDTVDNGIGLMAMKMSFLMDVVKNTNSLCSEIKGQGAAIRQQLEEIKVDTARINAIAESVNSMVDALRTIYAAINGMPTKVKDAIHGVLTNAIQNMNKVAGEVADLNKNLKSFSGSATELIGDITAASRSMRGVSTLVEVNVIKTVEAASATYFTATQDKTIEMMGDKLKDLQKILSNDALIDGVGRVADMLDDSKETMAALNHSLMEVKAYKDEIISILNTAREAGEISQKDFKEAVAEVNKTFTAINKGATDIGVKLGKIDASVDGIHTKTANIAVDVSSKMSRIMLDGFDKASKSMPAAIAELVSADNQATIPELLRSVLEERYVSDEDKAITP